MSSTHMNRIGGGSLPVPPPPPILTTNHPRSRRDGERSTRRSRSRSRNRERPLRSERFQSRSRRSNSPSYRRRDGKSGGSYSSGGPPTQQLPQQQTISVIPPKDIPQIIRRILNADDIKMPRRPHEGKKPIFDRDELRDTIANRIRSGCDDDAGSVLPHLEQQVVAIIREPVVSRDLSFASSLNLHLPSSVLDAQQISPGQFSGSGVGASFRRQQSLSPHSRGVGILTSRSLERIDRELRERDRERERDRRDRDRGAQPEVMNRGRTRSRSIEARRTERIHRSRSRTPSPMPPDMRRQLEYEDRDRDLRSSLSRPAGKSYASKFYGEHDRREASTSYRSRGSYRGTRRPFRSRGFQPRGSRGGHYERDRAGFWQHDMYEREEQESDDNKN